MKIISVNIERNKHFDTVIPFLEKENPDVVCIQEITESGISKFTDVFGTYLTFVPFTILKGFEEDVEGQKVGVAILSKRQHFVRGIHYYQGTEQVGVTTKTDIAEGTFHEHISRAVLVCDCVDDAGNNITVSTTHFTYTPDGEPDSWQERGLKKLLDELTPYADLLLTGDFNIPRANGLYKMLCDSFVDNISPDADSSLDPELHRVKGLRRMVDYFWTRGVYRAKDVQFRCGVSDHCAVVGEITVGE